MNISSDEHEIWDWAEKLSTYTQLLQRRRELKAKIIDIQLICGSCIYWMTKTCPYETTDIHTGRNKGPSAAKSKCNKFVMKGLEITLLEKWTEELKEIEFSISHTRGEK